MTGEFRPEARKRRLLIERLEGETLVYDLDNHRAHCLNPFAARLWEACNGRSTVAQIEKTGAWSEAEMLHGLKQLGEAGLLQQPPPIGPTRRRALGRLGRAAALPAVVSILAPVAASAASCIANGGFCGTNSARCCSGCCKRSGAGANTCVSTGSGACF